MFPEITKAAPGPSPSPQDHAAKLKERYLQRPLTLLWKSPPQSPDGGEGVSSAGGQQQSWPWQGLERSSARSNMANIVACGGRQ